MTSAQGKVLTLSELRVFELKQELEKRGLDKSGIKLALVERLEGAIRAEGHDPKTYKFVISDYAKSPTTATSKDPSGEMTTEGLLIIKIKFLARRNIYLLRE
ncbi:unnamed protein product [Gongylonema pulchrum]|uniref:SAP domain-containing protein n=1 Tax=Gongylonema pulchrum TaxID=637853 RepID=A0A183E442_9BILA|nr:unnamed protein product [Gongylonema pulchrum]